MIVVLTIWAILATIWGVWAHKKIKNNSAILRNSTK